MDAIAVDPQPSDSDSCPQCGHEVGDAWLVCAWCGQQLAAPAELAEGTRLAEGRYQILRVIGRGGFGITYDVGDRRLERRVAMKELFPESAVRHGSMVLTPPAGRPAFKAARDRFLREARVLARFTHPGIVRVFEVFEEHGTAYLVMELLEGRTLIDLLRQHGRPFDEGDVLDVAGRVAAALRPVHAAGVLHRDINPSNVMMTHHGRIVVIDFGLARDYDQDHTAGMTRVVTPGYAPLEQYRGEGRFGPSTDVYGLAATLYRLATGKVPVSALERSGGEPLPAPHRINPAISKQVSDALLDGLELEPTHRPQDLDSFLSRLGLARLPDGPRARLLDTVPVPPADPPSGATSVAPPFAPPAAVPPGRATPAPRAEVARAEEAGSGEDRNSPAVGAAPGVGAAASAAAAGVAAAAAGRNAGSAAGQGAAEDRSDRTVFDPAFASRGVGAGSASVGSAPPTSGGTGDRTVFDPAYGPVAGPARGGTLVDPERGGVPADRTVAPTGHRPAGDRTVAGGADPAGGYGAPDRTVADPHRYRPPATGVAGPATADHHVPRSAVHLPVAGPHDERPEPVRPAQADARLATALGPHRPGRRKVTVPLAAVAVALGAAAPVLTTALVVLVALPWLATVGDSVAHRLRVRHGVAGGWAERRLAPGALAPVRFVRNVFVSILRTSPVLGIGAVMLAGWYGLDGLDVPRSLLHLTLRLIGATVVGIVVVTSREGSHRFRTGLALDELVARWVPGGRTNERVVVGWLVAAAVVAGALWLTPSNFPLP